MSVPRRASGISSGSGSCVEGGGEGVDFRMIEAEKVLGRGEGDQVSSVEESDARTEKKGFANVMGDEDDGFIEAASQGAEFALKFGAGDGIECAEGLVHEENRRIGGQGSGDTDALTLAAGEFAGMACGEFGRVETYQVQ
jgi:hypothetical protein